MMENNSSIIFEGMTSLRPLFERYSFNDRKINKLYVDEKRIESKEKEIVFLKHKSEEFDFPISYISSAEINSLTSGTTHGGICAEVSDRSLPTIPEEKFDNGFYVYLEGIEDPFNFGYALRSLYAAGVDGIFLSPRNWMSASGVVAKSSAGTSERLPLYILEDVAQLESFKEKKYRIICAGIRNSVSAFDADLSRPLVLVVGGEKRGISSKTLSMADVIVRLDYGREFPGSLSAASAASILGYEVLRNNRK